jgi:hypothetical protein
MNKSLTLLSLGSAGLDVQRSGRQRAAIGRDGLGAWLATFVSAVRSKLTRPGMVSRRMLEDMGLDSQAIGPEAWPGPQGAWPSDPLARRGLEVADVLRFLRPGA